MPGLTFPASQQQSLRTRWSQPPFNRTVWSEALRWNESAHTQHRHPQPPPWLRHEEDGGICEAIRILCQKKQLDKALSILSHLHHPPSDVYSILLQSCRKAKALAYVKHIYAHLVQHDLNIRGSLGDHLVVAFAKCGALADAHCVFSSLPFRNDFSWTALISGYTDRGRCQEALDLYQHMLEDGVEPSEYTFVSLFQACACVQNLDEARKLHADARSRGFALEVFVGSTLVGTYGKCGSIVEGEDVFIELSQRNVVSWNAMLSAYVDQGQDEKAVWLFRQMQEEGVNSNLQTCLIAIQACASLAGIKEGTLQLTKTMVLEVGRGLHSYARKKGFMSHIFIWNTVVRLYGKCGSIAEVENMADGLFNLDASSWNALLLAYVEQDQGEKALQLYVQLIEEGTNMNEQTFMVVLQACSFLAEKENATSVDRQPADSMFLQMGQALHADLQVKGFTSNIFLGSVLVKMYAKCKSIVEAENAFISLVERDIVTWNGMISAYVEHDQGEKALQLFRQMQEEGICSDHLTLAIAIQACSSLVVKGDCFVDATQVADVSCLIIGESLHAQARRRKGFCLDVFIGSALVSMYAKLGRIAEAEHVFDGLLYRDAVVWNSMLSGYVEQAQEVKALLLYRQMREEGTHENHQTVFIVIQACVTKDEEAVQPAKLMCLRIGQALHAEARKKGFLTDVPVSISFLNMYAKYGSLVEAENVFEGLMKQHAKAWCAMISAYVEQCQGEKALHLYKQMQKEGVNPDQQIVVMAIQACGTLSSIKGTSVSIGHPKAVISLEIGRALHSDASRKDFTSDVCVCSSLVSMYGKYGTIADAEGVFHGMLDHNVVSWTAMLSAYVEQGEGDKALLLYRQMQEDGVYLTEITLLSVLQACIETGSIENCRQLHFEMFYSGYDLNYYVANTLLRAYGSCLSMRDGQAVFDGLEQRDVVSWNACIAGYAQEGNIEATEQKFWDMQLAGFLPNGVTFLSLMYACSHAGLVNKGIKYFDLMSEAYDLVPTFKHFVVILGLLGRVGDFVRAEIMLLGMPMLADMDIWLCLLSACCVHGNIEMGKWAFQHAVSVEPNEAAAYVFMSNIYVEAGMHAHVYDIETLD